MKFGHRLAGKQAERDRNITRKVGVIDNDRDHNGGWGWTQNLGLGKGKITGWLASSEVAHRC